MSLQSLGFQSAHGEAQGVPTAEMKLLRSCFNLTPQMPGWLPFDGRRGGPDPIDFEIEGGQAACILGTGNGWFCCSPPPLTLVNVDVITGAHSCLIPSSNSRKGFSAPLESRPLVFQGCPLPPCSFCGR